MTKTNRRIPAFNRLLKIYGVDIKILDDTKNEYGESTGFEVFGTVRAYKFKKYGSSLAGKPNRQETGTLYDTGQIGILAVGDHLGTIKTGSYIDIEGVLYQVKGIDTLDPTFVELQVEKTVGLNYEP